MVRPLPHRNSLADQVIEHVRALIAEGTYEVGSKLPPEAELSTMFGVGRSTIREAMRVLANRGLVSIKHGEGTFVTSVAFHESFEERLRRSKLGSIYEARQFLELPLAELAARRRDAKDIAAMRKCLKNRLKAIKIGDVELYAKADFDFHMAVASAAKNEALYGIYASFVEAVLPLLKTTITPDYIASENDPLHDALLEAIIEGNVTKTRRLVNEHLAKSLSGIAGRVDP